MGFPMAGHLSKLEYIDLYVYNQTLAISNKWLKKFTGSILPSIEDNEIVFDGVIICLKDDASIISVLLEKNLIGSIKKAGFILDHSTTSLDLVSKIIVHDTFISHKLSFFDAPVSGGESGAINGSLSVMAGGIKSKFIALKPFLETYSKTATYIGPNGHGQLTKMVNQLCISGLVQGLSEGITLGKKSNLQMDRVLEAISGGAAQSWQMDNRFKTMVKEKFDFGFAVDLMIKDLNIALKHSKNLNLELPISKLVLNKYTQLSKAGNGDMDTSSLIKLLDN